jgi:hypothetical protein
MRYPFKFTAVLLLLSSLLAPLGTRAGTPDDDYDRLDGTGRSAKRVNVIEWEGNLEVHVYPAGSVHGLAMKIDDRNPNKKVMVLGFRFKNHPEEQLIRRAILGIPLTADFQVYRDPKSGSEYDKFVITDRPARSSWVAFRRDPGPTQLYPEGHSALAEGTQAPSPSARLPASDASHRSGVDEDTGAIKPFNW